MSTPLAPAANGPQDVDVVAHTHWDREWYLPRETTLLRLQAVMAQVLDALDRGDLPTFLFDGQTVALEDLLAYPDQDLYAWIVEREPPPPEVDAEALAALRRFRDQVHQLPGAVRGG